MKCKLTNRKYRDVSYNAFTLVELLGVIILLGIIALVVYPMVDGVIKNSKEKALVQTKENILKAAYSYSVENDLGYETFEKKLELHKLQEKGFIKKGDIKDPTTGEDLTGCVIYKWNENSNQYEFKYSDECKLEEIEPTLVIINKNGVFKNGWAKEDFFVSIENNIEDYKYCISNSNCEPTTESTSGSVYISSEGSNFVCAISTNSKGSTGVICEEYKLDKTAPIPGTATFSDMTYNGWYRSDLTIQVHQGSDILSGHDNTVSNITYIDYDTAGTTIVITTTDLAGNSSTRNYTVKVDRNEPELSAKTGTFEITVGDNILVSSYFNIPTYGISGGSLSCNPTNTSSLAAGTRIVSCTVTAGNGFSATSNKTITVKNNIYFTQDNSGANAPELYNKMIPVVYNTNTGKWHYADTTKGWYNYNQKVWANSVVLNPGKSYSVGQDIEMTDIAMMYVWIPRYKYTIFNGNNGSVESQEINVAFESGTAKTGTVTCTANALGSGTSSENCGTITNGVSTYTHPAFTFGTTELKGIWVGKFEVSTTDSSCYNNPSVTNCNKNTHTITAKPNVDSLRYANVSNLFTSILNIKTKYSMSSVDTHMMRNMEWGAVAYLTQSKYGTCASGTCEVITINNVRNDSSNYYRTHTGCAGDSVNATSVTTCASTNTYETAKGIKASTTGNIYGVYDISGGALEFVMGNMVDSSGNFYSSNAGFGSAPNAKYYDKYTYGTDYQQYSRGRLGDATKETLRELSWTGGWLSDYAGFVTNDYPWFRRGGSASYAQGSGQFFFDYDNGVAHYENSARSVITAP